MTVCLAAPPLLRSQTTERSAQTVFKRSFLSLVLSCVISAFVGIVVVAHVLAPVPHLAGLAASGPPYPTAAFARQGEHGTLLLRLQSLLGLGVFTLMTYVWGQLRTKRTKVNWHTVLWGLGIQIIFAWLVLDTAPGAASFKIANDGIDALLGFAAQGSSFVFGDLVKGGNVPVGVPAGDPLNGPILAPTSYAHVGAYFAFNVLPTIIFFSALSTLLYHLGILQWVVQGLAWVMQKSMRTSGAETLSATANIFLGQTEAPLMVKPFIAGATNSELMAIMVGGFANIASGVLAAYVSMLHGFFPDIAGHLLAASLISAPSSLVIAKLLLPETETPETVSGVKFHIDKIDANAVDASARGALEGLGLTLNVGAVLIVFIALVAMLNALIGWGGHYFGHPELSFQEVLGWIATPFCWLMGISWHDAVRVGPLLGIKTALNEFVAYLQLSQSLGQNPHYISPRAAIITAYALCGFANFSSVAIQIGGIGGMAPNRRGDLSRLGLTAMWGGALSSFMTACVVGILL
jgi:CNT family concentrative nucleoside transporter